MDEWGKRELRTNKLVRLCASYLLSKKITPTNIYGLCKLTWITKNNNGAYISTKLPALSDIFDVDFSDLTNKELTNEVANLTGKPISELKELIYRDTGYTNFYNRHYIS